MFGKFYMPSQELAPRLLLQILNQREILDRPRQ